MCVRCCSRHGQSANDIDEIDEIVRFVYLGNWRAAQNRQGLARHGIRVVINLAQSSEITPRPLPADEAAELNPIAYHDFPIADDGSANIRQHFAATARLLDTAVEQQRPTLVHCVHGQSRSPTIVLAWLMRHTERSLVDVYTLVKSRRPLIDPNSGFRRQLRDDEWSLRGINSVGIEWLAEDDTRTLAAYDSQIRAKPPLDSPS